MSESLGCFSSVSEILKMVTVEGQSNRWTAIGHERLTLSTEKN